MKYSIDSIAFTNNLKDVNPKLKVLFSLLTLLVIVFSKSFIAPLLVFLISSYLIIFKAKVPAKVYFYLLLPAIGFGLFTVVFMGFWYGSEKIFSINLGFIEIGFTKEGLNQGILVFSRMLGGVSTMLFLALTTPMTQLFYVLRWLKLPKEFVDIAMMMYRYIFVLLDEFITMKNAQETRLGHKDIKTSYKSLGLLMANLFIRTWEKGEKLFITMSSRGYDGEIKVLKEIENPKLIYVIGIIIFEIFILIISILTSNIKVF